MSEDFEREVRAMLHGRADEVPGDDPASTEVVGRAARRRTAKIGALSTAVVVIVAITTAAVVGATRSKQSNVTTTTASVPVVGCPEVVGKGAPQPAPAVSSLAARPDLDPAIAAEVALFTIAENEAALSVLGPRGMACAEKFYDAGPIITLSVLPAANVGAFTQSTDEVWNGRGVTLQLVAESKECSGAACGSLPTKPITPAARIVRTTNGTNYTRLEFADGSRGANVIIAHLSTALTMAVMRCRLDDVALCDRIVDDYIRRAAPKPAPATPSTTTTSTLPRPTAVTVPGVGCALSNVFVTGSHGATTGVSRPVPGDSSTLGTLRAYQADPDQLRWSVLGPIGWGCRGIGHNGGGTEFHVYPASAQSFFPTGASVFAQPAYTGPEVRIDGGLLNWPNAAPAACAALAWEAYVQQWAVLSTPKADCVVKAGRVVTKVGPGAYRFTDADGTVGAAVMQYRKTSDSEGSYAIVTCNIPNMPTAECDTIISDYLTRNPGRVP